jgi:hypothetical protein
MTVRKIPHRNIALVLTLLCITAAHASESPCPLPPVEYDHPFKGILIFSEGHDQDTMRRLCRVTTLTVPLPACVVAKTDDWCVIVVAAPDQGSDPRDLVIRHEIGHCNGWSADHRGARPIKAEQTAYCEWKSKMISECGSLVGCQ